MKLLIIDTSDCVGSSLAWRASLAGHVVRFFMKPDARTNPKRLDGFPRIQKVSNWADHVKWADLIFVTGNDTYIPQLERRKQEGAKYFGPSVASRDLEVKRSFGMDFLKKHDIDTPPYRTFKSLKEAESFCWKSDYRWVFKTLGDNEDKSLSYCSKSPADMIARLQRWQKIGMNPKGEVMLQEFIPGMEYAVSRWMGKNGWIGLPCVNWEYKKLMPGNYGPNTGEMGTVMQYVRKDKIYSDILEPLGKSLQALGHLGDIDINCIIDEKGKAWPLEFTVRPGWPAFNLMLELHKGDPVKWMQDALEGKDTLEVIQDSAVCVVISQPDFPYSKMGYDKTEGIPIYGLTRSVLRHFQPQAVMIQTMPDMEGTKAVERPLWVTSGEYVGVVTATGSSVSQAIHRAYKTCDEIEIADKIVRNDIGKNLEEDLPKLKKMGYAEEVRWQ
jgi:phosphoribosylamine---glycine ligase